MRPVGAAIAAVALILGGCGDVTSSRTPWPADLDLVTLENVGDLPDADRTTTVVLRSDGGTSVDGAPGDVDALSAALGALSPRADFGPLDHDVLVVVEREVRWRRVTSVLEACTLSRAGRIWYAARPAAGSEPGAMALFLPVDASASRDIRHPGFFPIEIATHLEGAPSDPRGVGVRIPGGALGDRDLVRLRPSPSTPAWLALRLVDEALLAGAENVAFASLPEDESVGAQAVEARAPALHVTLEGEPLPAGDTERLPRPRVRGRAAGIAHHVRDGWNSTGPPRRAPATR